MLSSSVFSSAWVLRKSLPSPNADGGSRSIQDSQVPSLVSQTDSSPSSPTGHNWEMNYQEAAIYLQVSAAGSAWGGGDGGACSEGCCGLPACPCSTLEQECVPVPPRSPICGYACSRQVSSLSPLSSQDHIHRPSSQGILRTLYCSRRVFTLWGDLLGLFFSCTLLPLSGLIVHACWGFFFSFLFSFFVF